MTLYRSDSITQQSNVVNHAGICLHLVLMLIKKRVGLVVYIQIVLQ